MLCDVGLVGTSFFLCVLGIIGYKSIKSKNVLAIALLVTGFVPSFFIGAINKRFFWNAIIISMMVLRAHSNMSSKVEVSLNKN